MVFPAFECGGPSQLMARITVHVKVTFGSKKLLKKKYFFYLIVL